MNKNNAQWHGGKGSKSRILDYNKYSNNWDKVFKKDKPKEKYKLFLDDYRNPKDAYLYDEEMSLKAASGVNDYEWVVVRNYDQFVAYIDSEGIPEVVSFDNDLNDHHMNYFQIALLKGGIYDIHQVTKTGIHCAMFLKEKCKELGVPIPKYYVHSANHLSRPIIREILQ